MSESTSFDQWCAKENLEYKVENKMFVFTTRKTISNDVEHDHKVWEIKYLHIMHFHKFNP